AGPVPVVSAASDAISPVAPTSASRRARDLFMYPAPPRRGNGPQPSPCPGTLERARPVDRAAGRDEATRHRDRAGWWARPAVPPAGGSRTAILYPSAVDWSLRACARKGHVTYAPTEPELRRRLHAATPVGEAWRCLRCGAFVPGRPHGSGPADDAPLVPRGR